MRRPPTRTRLLAPLLAVATLSGCVMVPLDERPDPADGVPQRPEGAVAARAVEAEPDCDPAPLRQRAAAVLVVGLPGVTAPTDDLAVEVASLDVGGVFLSGENILALEQTTELVEGLRDGSDRPMVVATDEESGRVSTARAVVGPGPSPRRLAAEGRPEHVRALAREIGSGLHDVGVDLNLAPVLDLEDGDADGIIGDRSFSAAPDTAAAYGLAFAAGLDDAGVLPTVKHFPGHGRSEADTHSTSSHVGTPMSELWHTDLVPFRHAIEQGAPVIMLNHLVYEDLDRRRPASMSPAVYEYLRDMGFEGVAMTDSVGMGPVHRKWPYPEAAVQAIGAGADAVLATDGTQARVMRDALVRAVRAGTLPEDRLDEAAGRMAALAGADPARFACVDVELPELDVDDDLLQDLGVGEGGADDEPDEGTDEPWWVP